MVRRNIDLNPKNEVVGFSGSPRVGGNSDILLKSVIDGVSRENVYATYMNLSTVKFKGCIGCERCRKDKICTGIVDGMSVLYDTIISSKGLILVSPTHNYNITSWMKAFIDRLYCFYNFANDRPRSWSSQLANQGRKAVIVAICEQERKEDMGFTLEAMSKPLEAIGYEIVGEHAILQVFDKAKIKENMTEIKKATELGRKLAKTIINEPTD